MTTTSGSPTQNSTDTQTPGGLQGVPDDAFQEGDFGYVSSLWPNASFRLRRGIPVAPDGVSILSTLSGNGYWEVFKQADSSEVSSVARVEDLADRQDAMTSGSFAYVESVRSYFQKIVEPDLGGQDGITSVRDDSTGATWYRVDVRSLSWELQANWYIDASVGDDQNPGTAIAPLATFAEFARRVRFVRVLTTVYVVSATSEVFRGVFYAITSTARLDIRGVPTVIASGSTTTFTAMGTTTNTLATVACAEIPTLATHVGKMLRVTYSGHKLTTHIIKNNAGTAVIGGVFAADLIYSYNPVPNGNPLEVIEVVPVGSVQVTVLLKSLNVYYLRQKSTTDAFHVYCSGLFGSSVDSCEFEGDVDIWSSRGFSGCLFTGSGKLINGYTLLSGLGYPFFNGGTFDQRICEIKEGRATFQGTIVYKAPAIFGEPGRGGQVRITASAGAYSLGVFESPTHGFDVYGNAILGYRLFFGKDNLGYGMVFRKGARLFSPGTNYPRVTGALGDFFYRDGGNQISPLLAGANVPNAVAFASWANYTAAPFSQAILSYEDGTQINSR